MIEYVNAINKYYRYFEDEIIIQQEAKVNPILLFDFLEETIKKIEYKNLEINHSEMFKKLKKEQLDYLLIIYFFSNNLCILDNSVIIDQAKVLFMKINYYINKVFNLNNSFLVFKNELKKKVISWNLSENKTTRIDYYSDMIDNKYDSYNELKFALDNNKEAYLYYKDNKVIDEDLKQMFFIVSKELFKKHFNMFFIKNIEKSITIINKDFYIKPNKIIENIKIEKFVKNATVNIIHISDTHISKNSDFAKSFLDLYNKEVFLVKDVEEKQDSKIKRIDLIVLTGDIIQAGKSSKEILGNYVNAYKNIQMICMDLLGNLWDSRFIIVPGNHDYGMINELKINFADRSYKNTEVVVDTNEFEKFVFFHLIFDDFSLRENNLKSLSENRGCIDYDIIIDEDKKIKFYLINTSMTANAIRSNKVSLTVPQNSKEQVKTYLLMHHTPLFKINYYKDIFAGYYEECFYGYILGISDEEYLKIISLLEDIKNGNEEEADKLLIELQEICTQYNEKLSKLSKEKIINHFLSEKIKEMILKNNKLMKSLEKCKLYRINTYNEIELNEMLEVISYFLMSKSDRGSYDSNFDMIKQKFSNFTILGGHQHTQQIKFEKNYKIVEAGRTIVDNKSDEKQTEEKKLYYTYIEYGLNEEKIYSSVKMEPKENELYVEKNDIF